jgi:hypothetical protein
VDVRVDSRDLLIFVVLGRLDLDDRLVKLTLRHDLRAIG